MWDKGRRPMYIRLASRQKYAAIDIAPCEITTANTSGIWSRTSRLILNTDPNRNESIHRRKPGIVLLKNHTA
ncbi:hypothetical protein D3C72_2186060 [compost metagenome]